MRSLLLALLCAFACACTHQYVPAEYPLTAERIPPVSASAPVVVVNVQTRATDERLFTLGVHKFDGNYRALTQHFADQLSRALLDAGVKVVSDGAPKRLDVSILAVSASNAFFHLKGQAVFSVTTGDGQRFDLVANNGSPGNIYRTMNGTLAIAVLETLKHPGVQAYLAAPASQTVASGTPTAQ